MDNPQYGQAIFSGDHRFGPAAQTAQRPASEARDQTLYVSVLGPKNAPVTGLSAADFTVREDFLASHTVSG